MEIREVEVLANRRIRGLPPDTAATSFSKAACPPAGGAVKLTLTSVPLFATKFSRTFWRATDSGCTAGFHPQKSMATPLTSAGRGAPPSSPPHPIAATRSVPEAAWRTFLLVRTARRSRITYSPCRRIPRPCRTPRHGVGACCPGRRLLRGDLFGFVPKSTVSNTCYPRFRQNVFRLFWHGANWRSSLRIREPKRRPVSCWPGSHVLREWKPPVLERSRLA